MYHSSEKRQQCGMTHDHSPSFIAVRSQEEKPRSMVLRRRRCVFSWRSCAYPLVNIQKTMENHHL